MPEMELVDSLPAPAPTPAPDVPSPTPTDPVTAPEVAPSPEAPATDTPADPQLFKLPDGREVDAAGLQREYENLLPEFTRRSQRLAELERGTQKPINTEEPAWKSPDYSPASWAEAIEIAKGEAIAELTRNAESAQAEEATVRNEVETQLASIKVADPKVDENALFDHAVKYGFNDLKAAHSNFKAMRDIAVTTEQRVLKNLQDRAADPIATNPTPAPVAPSSQLAPANLGHYRGALDFLEALKSKS